MKVNAIPADIGDHISYDPKTGLLRWRIAQNSRSFPGNVCGSVGGKGYVSLKFRSVRFQAHRVAYFLMTGTQPGEIDHIDRCRSNNRWVNLREVSRAENMLNREAPVGQTGVRGVTPHNSGYRAVLSRGNRRTHLGTYPTIDEAAIAYRQAVHGGRREDVASTTGTEG